MIPLYKFVVTAINISKSNHSHTKYTNQINKQIIEMLYWHLKSEDESQTYYDTGKTYIILSKLKMFAFNFRS